MSNNYVDLISDKVYLITCIIIIKYIINIGITLKLLIKDRDRKNIKGKKVCVYKKQIIEGVLEAFNSINQFEI